MGTVAPGGGHLVQSKNRGMKASQSRSVRLVAIDGPPYVAFSQGKELSDEPPNVNGEWGMGIGPIAPSHQHEAAPTKKEMETKIELLL